MFKLHFSKKASRRNYFRPHVLNSFYFIFTYVNQLLRTGWDENNSAINILDKNILIDFFYYMCNKYFGNQTKVAHAYMYVQKIALC